GDLLRCAQPAQRLPRGQLVQGLAGVLDELPHPGRIDGSRTDGVDADAVVHVVDRERTGQGDHRPFRGTVRRPVAKAHDGCDGRANAKLAEGPCWDAATRRLLWVDIEGCELHVLESGGDRAIALDAMVGAAAPTTGGSVLVALADRLALVDLADESSRTLVRLPHGPAIRSNDGACDAAGRFWIGTMALDLTPGAAALYRYDGGLER